MHDARPLRGIVFGNFKELHAHVFQPPDGITGSLDKGMNDPRVCFPVRVAKGPLYQLVCVGIILQPFQRRTFGSKETSGECCVTPGAMPFFKDDCLGTFFGSWQWQQQDRFLRLR